MIRTLLNTPCLTQDEIVKVGNLLHVLADIKATYPPLYWHIYKEAELQDANFENFENIKLVFGGDSIIREIDQYLLLREVNSSSCCVIS